MLNHCFIPETNVVITLEISYTSTEKKKKKDMQQQRVGKGHVNTEAEVGFMSSQPEGHKELPEVGKSKEVSTPWGLLRRLSAKEPTCQYKKRRFEPWVKEDPSWVRKIPRKRKWPLTPLFLPGKSHGKRSLVGYSPWDGKTSWTQLSN